MTQIVVGHRSWTETPALIFRQIKDRFPQLAKDYKVGRGRVYYLLHRKEAYRIGIVFPLTRRTDVGRADKRECLIYYPAKEMYVRSSWPVLHYSIGSPTSYQTKRGLMQVVKLGKEPVITFVSGYSRIQG